MAKDISDADIRRALQEEQLKSKGFYKGMRREIERIKSVLSFLRGSRLEEESEA